VRFLTVRPFGVAALAATATVTLAACGGGSNHPAPAHTAAPKPPQLCPLTGQPVQNGQKPDRVALAVKIDNVDVARPQSGLNRADLVIEETVEGGLTRLFTVFQCNSVKTIGPVRSARTSDAALLRLLGRAVFAYSGANPKAIAPVAATSHAVLLSYDANGTLFHRDSSRPAPHNVYSSTKTLVDAGLKRDGSLRAPAPVFTFSAASTAGTAAHSISLRWSPNANAGWSWAGQRWVRTQNGTPDVLANHQRVDAANVVVMRITTKDTGLRDVIGNPSPDDVVTGSGKVWVFRDGKVVTGRWKRPGIGSPMTLVDAQGNAINLAPGRTWIELLPRPGTISLR